MSGHEGTDVGVTAVQTPRGPDGRDQGAHDRDLRDLARGSTLNLVGTVVAAALGLVLPVIITRSYDEAEAGLFFQATALFVILLNVGVLGADTGLLRSLPQALALQRRRELRRQLWVAVLPAVVAALAIAAGMLLAVDPLSRLLTTDPGGRAAFRDVLLVLLPWLPVAVVYTIVVAGSRGLGSIRPLVLVEKIGRHSLETGGAAVAASVSTSLALIATAWVAPYLAMLLVITAWVVRRLRLVDRRAEAQHGDGTHGDEPEPRRWRELGPEFWRFALPTAASRTCTVVLQRFDILVVGALRGPADAAVYAAATRFVVLGLMLVQAIQQVMAPRIAEFLALDDPARAERIYRTTTAWLTLVSWPIYLVAAMFAPLIMLVFGPSYQRGATAAAILCLSMLVATACGPVDSVLLMSGRSGLSFLNTGVALGLTIGLDLLLVPLWGPTGAALGWAAGILVKNLLGLWQVHRHVGVHPLGAGTRTAMAGTLVSFGLVAGACRLVLGSTWWSLVLAGLLGAAALAVLAGRRAEQLDLAELAAVLRRRR